MTPVVETQETLLAKGRYAKAVLSTLSGVRLSAGVVLKQENEMSDVSRQTVEALRQFTEDLEAGDLSRYRITRMVDCPECSGKGEDRDLIWDILNCWNCSGRGKILVVVQEGD